MRTTQIIKRLSDDLIEVDPEQLIAEERNTEIRKIEETVNDNHQLFVDVSLLVSQQGDGIDNIEANMNLAIAHTDAGVKSLERAEVHQSKCNVM